MCDLNWEQYAAKCQEGSQLFCFSSKQVKMKECIVIKIFILEENYKVWIGGGFIFCLPASLAISIRGGFEVVF